MRHAESQANQHVESLRKSLKDPENPMTEPEYDSQMRSYKSCLNPKMINACLSETGITGAKSVQKNLEKYHKNIKRIILSPMRRVIQTFEYAFSEYPQFKQNTLKISFIPELRECLTSTACVGTWTEDQFEDLKHLHLYDFSFMESFPNPNFWFFYSMMPSKIQEAESIISEGKTTQEKLSSLADNFAEVYPKKWEGNESSYQRMTVARKKLWEIIKEENLQDGELCIITHKNTLNWFLDYDKKTQTLEEIHKFKSEIEIGNNEIIVVDFKLD